MTDVSAPPTDTIRLPPELDRAFNELLQRAIDERWAERIWARDVTVWTEDTEVGEKIANRLGWLDAPASFLERADLLKAFAEGILGEGFAQAIVCGMGGSSLAPEVIARTYPAAERGIPLYVLDSTDPVAVLAMREVHDPLQTLYLIATKSGTTTETLSFLGYFWAVLDDLHHAIPDSAPGQHFVAITDPGKSVDAIPHNEAFREVFLNPADVGGRYSALTYVGLVPAALLGVDLRALLEGAGRMADRCRDAGPDNPGVRLGALMASMARAGRDKLTLIVDPAIPSFGAWAEQLIAESTGKQGTGIVPIDGEPLGASAVYGDDRVFVRILAADGDASWRAQSDAALEELAGAGHPVVDLEVRPDEGLGGEFFRWEYATAVAGAGMGVNPFDEPNVTESKDNTRRVLAQYAESGELPRPEPMATEGRLALVPDAALRLTGEEKDLPRELARHLARARPGAYVAFQAYFASVPHRDRELEELRRLVRDRTRLATTVGYGPRFLHSTGQLHKGGPRTGCFIQLVVSHPVDAPIPDGETTFGTLIDAQALGDFQSLESHELPVVQIHLSDDPEAGLAALTAAMSGALDSPGAG